MILSPPVLKESRKSNIFQFTHSWTFEVKHTNFKKNSDPTSIAASYPVRQLMDNATTSVKPSTQFSMSTTTTYFSSPLRTLTLSIKDPGHECISIHDLAEAYNVLSTRIRSLNGQLDEASPSVSVFKERSSDIAYCLGRDIRCILPNPFKEQSYQHSFVGHSYFTDDSSDDEETQLLTENDLLCQYALRFTSDLFTFRAIHSYFADFELTDLLRAALSPCIKLSRPIFNSRKICALAIWVLGTQRLPFPALNSAKSDIVSTLMNSLSLDVGGSTGKLDALQAIHSILTRHPSFSVAFSELLPSVLGHLNAESLELRLKAALAISGFAVAKLSSPDQFPQTEIGKMLQQYLDVQTSRGRRAGSEHLLPSMFKAALADEEAWRGSGPSFAIGVTSCIVVLLDRFFFSSPRSLKLVYSVITLCAGHRKDNIRSVHPELWRLLIWVFARLPITFDPGDSPSDQSLRQDTRDPAFLILRQELKHGLATGLIDVLLRADGVGEKRKDDVTRVMTILADLVKSDHAPSRDVGSAMLCRLIASIGSSSSDRTHGGERLDVRFSRELIDGQLLSKSSREIRVRATETNDLIPILPPLLEEEVNHHWIALADIWASIVQQRLGLGFDLTPDDLRVWQALLLVKGALATEHKYLTAPPAFSSRFASVITKFSTSIDTAEAQARYLSFVTKLWTVMKNVFTSASLSSPAEVILASLLKKQFSLSDDKVKELWSQLCADLISVGIPSLLHVLHRRSESQEGPEVTRQLWVLLAENGPLASGAEDWIHLLHFLAMPLGVWDMSHQECEIWESILQKALVFAVKVSQARHTVVSRFIELLGENKLASLKRVPRLSQCLLAQSLPTSCSEMNVKLLRVIDEALVLCYNATVEEKACALSILRSISSVISQSNESEIVRFLSALQQGISCWIADEEEVLQENEHSALVTTLYTKSLDLLARLEPSIATLNAVSTFVQSVFVRVRGDGPLIFHNFWRKTYHKCPDIPKNEYPVLIQGCLKAWSDFCEDSLADGVSLGSASQNPASWIIPDSQPSMQKPSGSIDASLYEIGHFDPRTTRAVDVGGDRASSQDTVTPVPPNTTSEARPGGKTTHQGRALQDLQEYTSRYIDSGQEPSRVKRPANDLHDMLPVASTSKQPLEADADVVSSAPRTPKRRRLDIPVIRARPRAGKERVRSPPESGILKRTSERKESRSEPVTRMHSIVEPSLQSASQPSRSRKRRRSETPSWLGSDLRKLQLPEKDYYEDDVMTSPVAQPSDDYDTWEQTVSAEDLRGLNDSRLLIPDAEDNADFAIGREGTEPMLEDVNQDGEQILTPSMVGRHPSRSKLQYRSQTAPAPLTGSHSESMANALPLRRNQTTPTGHRRSASAHVDALQHAYALITDTGTSQVDVQDLLHARRLANQINQALDEKMCSKIRPADR
ncbi:hypothetical protein M413DRAFT_449530 [Hebeloma cylindrosporum]|uniref:Telomere-associated protein Rif1 N-terminal domain-containing protein n=1 Tax=Hebeloma cylindrosporum TaxID=76867 RepID=A0A0C2Y4A8_HEBCY|nr:hypothetical protein M413DRAFT_449530 [Hebeloma cylindrosporum h7]